MNLVAIVAVVSGLMTLVNAAAMILMYLRYVRSAHHLILAVRADEAGEVEVLDLLSDSVRTGILNR